MFDWLGISAVNPLLLWGGLAVAAPIVIHLLARRKFRVVDWAAMAFLLDANRRNRRRIRLEHLILLLLRCLAVLLIALLVARLFHRSTGLAALIGQAARTERLVLLDDSPSMQLAAEGDTVFDRAVDAVGRFVRQAAQEKPGDTFTLLTTSRPDQPIVNGRYFEQAADITASLDALAPADVAADLPRAVLAIGDLIDDADQRGAANVNRVIYIVTDLRRRDWPVAGSDDPPDADLPALLERLSKRTDGLVVVNVGREGEANLAVTAVEPAEHTLVAGVPARFEITLANPGPAPASNVEVAFTVGNAPPLSGAIAVVPGGGKASVPFTFTFSETGSARATAAIGPDALPVDNARHFAVRVHQGVKVLLVDGDPSSEPVRRETFYLHRALDPPGDRPSGNDVDVITENQFQSTDLAAYQAVVLANTYQITVNQRDALEQWVRQGGGLVIALGDQVDPDLFGEMLHRDGEGLSPVRLVQVDGDPTERRWVNLDLRRPNHPILRVFAGEANPFLGRVKFFRYWRMVVPDDLLATGQAGVIATFNDPDASPAIVERAFGDGRVIVIASTLDDDWNRWPSDPSYVVTALETVRHTARPRAAMGNLEVGQPIIHPLDIARDQATARLRLPGDDQPIALQAVPEQAGLENDTDRLAPASARMIFRYDRTDRHGIYDLQLTGHDGTERSVLFAANIDPTEGDLTAANLPALRDRLEEAHVQFVQSAAYLDTAAAGGRAELWRGILVALVCVLCAEQLLAFVFGRRR